MKKIMLSIMGLSLLFIEVRGQDPWTGGRPDGHAPISVMGDHYHSKGDWMFSYRYMPMWMKGNLLGTDKIDNSVIYQDYMVAPQKMQMNMHMLGFMYAPSDKITVMIMSNYVSNSMDLRTGMGVDFTTKSEGLGDLSISALVKILNRNRTSLHANLGISIPTGDIDRKDNTPMMDDVQLAYPMQLGSGTWDPFVGLTWLKQSERFSLGAQSLFRFRIGENSRDYSLGNRLDAVGWGSLKISKMFSLSASLAYFDITAINGADEELTPMMMPLFNTDNSGRSQLDAGLGINFYIPSGTLKNFRLGTEVKFPIYQKVNGIQMKNEWMATFGVQYAVGHKKH